MLTSLSCSVRLPGGRVISLCMAKEKSPGERPPGAAFFVHPWTKNPCGPAGLADAPSLARRQVGAIPCAHPAGLIVGPHRSTGVQKKLCFDSGHRGLAGNETKQFASSSHAHRMCVQWGPSNTAGGRRISPKDGPQDAGQFAAGIWMCRWRTPAAARAS